MNIENLHMPIGRIDPLLNGVTAADVYLNAAPDRIAFGTIGPN
jgi:hypothetical protein